MENRTILVVEDDFLNRRLIKKALIENTCKVVEAKNAKETFDILSKHEIDLIILDINIGEDSQDGISIGEQIKAKYNLPFIYLTAYENNEIISKAITTTPYSYLTKPFKNSDLIASVQLAIWQSGNNKKYKPSIVVKDEDYNIQLPISEIDFIESEGNYLLFHADKKVYKSRSTIKQILEILPKNNFIQIHRAYIVNKFKIEKFTIKNVVINGRQIPVSKNYFEFLNNFIKP